MSSEERAAQALERIAHATERAAAAIEANTQAMREAMEKQADHVGELVQPMLNACAGLVLIADKIEEFVDAT